MRATYQLNTEKLEYNYRVLTERDMENSATLAHQKRKLTKLKDALSGLMQVNYRILGGELVERDAATETCVKGSTFCRQKCDRTRKSLSHQHGSSDAKSASGSLDEMLA